MSARRKRQTTTRLPADAMNIFQHLDLSDVKPYGKRGCKISYINLQNKGLRLQVGTCDNPVTFPFGVSEPFDENNQQGGQNSYQAYQQGFQAQAGYGFPQQQMNYAQQPQQGQGWNNPMGPQPLPGAAPMAGAPTTKKTLRIQFKEDSDEYRMLEKWDEEILKLCAKNWPRWFKEEKTTAQLVERYSCALKLKDQNGNPVPPGLGTKLDLDDLDVEIYAGEDPDGQTDESGNPLKIKYPGTVKDVTKRSGGRAVIEPVGVWFLGGKFGVTFRTKRISVFANFDDEEDGFVEEEPVEMRPRPDHLIMKGANGASEADGHDFPSEAHDGATTSGTKRTAEQAGLAQPPQATPPPQPSMTDRQPFAQPNAPVQIVAPGQAILPPM